jgi:hypothetical protein
MKTYKSHKIVKAAKITGCAYYALTELPEDSTLIAELHLSDGETRAVTHGWMKKQAGEGYAGIDAERDLVGGYFVAYPDGYTSWSPAEAFEDGYIEMANATSDTVYDPKDGALPVAGYKPQTQTKVDCVNAMKVREELILQQLDHMKNDPEVDQRWLAIGRASLEQAFMAINRSIFRPGRVTL